MCSYRRYNIVFTRSGSKLKVIFLFTLGESLFTSTIIDIQPYLNKKCQFYNYYGPTECSESSIEHMISDEDLAYGFIPLGRPMASVSVYLVDDYLIPVISDIHVGEIVIGGMFSLKWIIIVHTVYFS